MKVTKERRQLCIDVTNHHKTEERIRIIKKIERQLDVVFLGSLLFALVVAFVIALVDIWGSL